ncbi:amino acid kinase family [Anaerococcus lactolyticus ATCC 51172]|uniref:Aspartokinase n=1 Tax=Anaerococcus lactolyticus ATCC 51172 TaxID=525254 RepID=C2BEW6_9FIRM|nr:aspartate kinase [Anaerococcus lactolyticus]EEI86497.1 amino acid kinase family [Anaerococcus lactolyticus ATCC 51172]
MKVAKFGGSSLADAVQLKKVRDIIFADDARRYIVVSAPGKGVNNNHKVTDLLAMCHQLSNHDLNFNEVYKIIEDVYKNIVDDLSLLIDIDKILAEVKEEISKGASYDFVISRGEYMSAQVLASFIGYDFVDAKDLIVFTDGVLDLKRSQDAIEKVLANHEKAVIPGFYGMEDGKVKTFSRGGSDVTGSVIAAALGADMYENFTDVSGFLVADPRIVKNPAPIGTITYKELRELSYMGANVLHEEAIFPLRDKNIPINIKNTNKPDKPGTLILSKCDIKNKNILTGITGKKDFTVINLEKVNMNSEKDFFRKLTTVFESNDISIEHMPSSIDSVSVLVADSYITPKLNKVLEELKIYLNVDSISWERDISLIAVVGRGMIKEKGVSSRTFTALAREGVNIKMISQGSSEINIIIGVETKDFEKAIQSIYDEFYKEV